MITITGEQSHRENKNYRESNIILHDIINSNDSSENLKFKAYFLLADIYLNLEYYKESIESYKSILSASTDNPLRGKSLFMIGYIYNNNLDMYSHAKKYYNLFTQALQVNINILKNSCNYTLALND